MTLTIDVPDSLAAHIHALPERERERVDRAIVRAIEESIATPRLHSVLEFAGVGKGRPGAIGDDVQGYIGTIRDEWQEREESLVLRRAKSRTPP